MPLTTNNQILEIKMEVYDIKLVYLKGGLPLLCNFYMDCLRM